MRRVSPGASEGAGCHTWALGPCLRDRKRTQFRSSGPQLVVVCHSTPGHAPPGWPWPVGGSLSWVESEVHGAPRQGPPRQRLWEAPFLPPTARQSHGRGEPGLGAAAASRSEGSRFQVLLPRRGGRPKSPGWNPGSSNRAEEQLIFSGHPFFPSPSAEPLHDHLGQCHLTEA